MSQEAKIKLSVDTSGLAKGTVELTKFKETAKSAYASAEQFSQTASKAMNRVKSVASGGIMSMSGTAKATMEVNTATKNWNAQVLSIAKGQMQATKAIKETTQAMKDQVKMAANGDINTRGREMGVKNANGGFRDQGVNRFNTANVAAQFQDIAVTAAMGMNPLTIALQQGTQLSAVLNQMKNPVQALGEAFKSILNPVSLVTMGITALIALIVQVIDWGSVWKSMTGTLVTALEWLRDNLNEVIIAMVAFIAVQMITHIKLLVTSLYTLAASLAKVALGWIAAMGPVGWVAAGIATVSIAIYEFRDEIADLMGESVLSNIKIGLNKFIAFFVGSFKAIGAAADWLADRITSVIPGLGGTTMKGGITDYMAESFDQAFETDYVGEAGNAVDKFISTIKTGIQKGIDSLTEDDLIKKLNDYSNDTIKGLENEADLIGRIGYDLEYTKAKIDLVKESGKSWDELTKEQQTTIEELATKIGLTANKLDILKDRFDFAKSSTTSFFQDMNHSLLEGESMWEAFGDAVTNVLSKILDKITEIGVDTLFSAGKSAGWFTLGSGTTTTPVQALGGVWDKGVQKFATGGVVSSPTAFGTRSGLGVMGEAGPEAIMPLTRGANGSLGVKADGIGGSNVVVNVINNSNAQATVNQRQTNNGTEIDVMIDQMVAEKLSTQGTATNTALTGWNNRQLIAR